MDYAGIHVWPDAWDVETPEFQKQFILNRAKLVNGKKPFVLEEFGIIVGKSPEERKEDMKKRGADSPDRADALAMTFYHLVPVKEANEDSYEPETV